MCSPKKWRLSRPNHRKEKKPPADRQYLPRTVTNILHNIQSAFIDINEGENGFIHISDILKIRKKFEELFDMDFDLDMDIQSEDRKRTEETDISNKS